MSIKTAILIEGALITAFVLSIMMGGKHASTQASIKLPLATPNMPLEACMKSAIQMIDMAEISKCADRGGCDKLTAEDKAQLKEHESSQRSFCYGKYR